MTKVKVAEGYHSATPYLGVQGAPRLIDFMKDVFGAEEISRMPMPDGSVGHAELKVGDSVIMTGDAGEFKPMVHLYVPDVDAAYQRALAAGATSLREPADQSYGDRNAQIKDPLGNIWFIAAPIQGEQLDRSATKQAAQALYHTLRSSKEDN
jgi:PhnB protein